MFKGETHYSSFADCCHVGMWSSNITASNSQEMLKKVLINTLNTGQRQREGEEERVKESERKKRMGRE